MKKTIIIAEAGVNHNGDIALAKKMVDVATAAGVDYVKFQTFKADKLVDKKAKKASYQIENTKSDDSQYEMLKQLELSEKDHFELIQYCNNKRIKFLSTAFDIDSIEFLKDKLDFYKIPSGEITNYPYLVKVAGLGLPIVMSTGMATLEEVKDAFDVLINHGAKKDEITVLHCNTEYPTPMKDVNLNAMLTIKKELGVNIGYSDHTLGIEVPIAAVAMGAKVIEKHFTLDRNMPGPDHRASLEPDELNAMVRGIRNIEIAMGDGIKKPSESEKKNIAIVRKSLHLKHDLMKGHVLSSYDFNILRPSKGGISPMALKFLVGKKIKHDLRKGDKINLIDLEDEH